MKVIKRNGDLVDYDLEKISIAISGAFEELGSVFKDAKMLDEINSKINTLFQEKVSVEQIQDIVEETLCENKYINEARAYIKYRYDHQIRRQIRNDKEFLEMLNGTNEYWAKENSNKNAVLTTVQRDYLAGIVSTDLAREYIFDKETMEAHDKGWCHQHDMDYMAQATLHNCDLINLEDMLQNGTVINNVHINKPHRLLTAMTITTQIMAAVASAQYGGQSLTLTHLAPFVRSSYEIYLKKYSKEPELSQETVIRLAKADLKKEIEDAVQTFNYQASTLFSLNGQAPFCSLFMYLNETDEYKNELAMLIEEFLRQRMDGLPNRQGVNVTQAFPKLLYVLEEDNVRPGTKYWYLTKMAALCSSKRLTPDYISEKVMKEIKQDKYGRGYCFPMMGCRSALSVWLDENDKAKFYGRWNCGVSSLNLPDAAFAAHGDINKFWEILDKRAEICHKGLKVRIERLSNTKAAVAPILWMDGALARLNPDDTLSDLVHGGYATASLGYVGMYECVKILTGKSNTSKEGAELATKILEFLNKKCEEWKAVEDVGYSIYGTPAESLCYKFATKTRKNYPKEMEELFPGKEYFENSFHVSSSEPIGAFEKISFESQFQKLSSGGSIIYIESCDISNNQEIMYALLEHIYNTTMYCEINIVTSYCQTCGQSQTVQIDKDENGRGYWHCINCGETDTNKMNVAARTCGLKI